MRIRQTSIARERCSMPVSSNPHIIQKLTFINSLLLTNNAVMHTLYKTVAKDEISTYAAKFDCEEHVFNRIYRLHVHNHFKSELIT